MSLSEFVIWGKEPGAKHESLLISERGGLMDEAHARRIMEKLDRDHGCTEMRIQRLEPLGDAGEVAAMFRNAVKS